MKGWFFYYTEKGNVFDNAIVYNNINAREENAMQPIELIKASLEYIEQNLKTDITVNELAQEANYSIWHFCLLFNKIIGSSVASYILKRRLDNAISEISVGRKAIDVILEYGFDTYSGFYKAFVKIYGCSPKRYLNIYKNHTVRKLEELVMHSEQDLRKVLENWDFSKKLKIENIHIGLDSRISDNTWKVGRYYLKTGERDKIIKNIKIAKSLNQQGFNSYTPILTKNGSEYLDGENIFMLTDNIKGIPLDKNLRFGEKRAEYGYKYGQSIAKLHKALKNIQEYFELDEANIYKQVTEWALPAVQKQNDQWNMNISEDFFSDYTETFGKLYDKLPKQLIHRDTHGGNILFDDGEISGFIDFDLSEFNVRLFDPCYCATGLLSEQINLKESCKKWFDILQAILKGYDCVNKLTDEERQAIFYVICSIQMICIAYFESIEEYKWLAKINREILVFIVNSKENIIDIF